MWRRVGRSSLGTGLIGFAVTSGARDVLASATLEQVKATPMHSRRSATSALFRRAVRRRTPMRIEWVQREPHPVMLSSSLDNGETWTAIPECTAVLANSCTWNSPSRVGSCADPGGFRRHRLPDGVDRKRRVRDSSGQLSPLPGGADQPRYRQCRDNRLCDLLAGARIVGGGRLGRRHRGFGDEFHFVSRPITEQRGQDVESSRHRVDRDVRALAGRGHGQSVRRRRRSPRNRTGANVRVQPHGRSFTPSCVAERREAPPLPRWQPPSATPCGCGSSSAVAAFQCITARFFSLL